MIYKNPRKSITAISKSSEFQGTVLEEWRMWTFDTSDMRFREASSCVQIPKITIWLGRSACWAMWNMWSLEWFIASLMKQVYQTNDRLLCADPKDISMVILTEVLRTLIVLGVERNEKNVMHAHVFHHGLTANAPDYKSWTGIWSLGYCVKEYRTPTNKFQRRLMNPRFRVLMITSPQSYGFLTFKIWVCWTILYWQVERENN